MRPRRWLARNATLLVAAIATALLLSEIFLRATRFGQTNFYIYDSYLGWTLKPGARGWQSDEGKAWLRVNRWGYRGREWPLQKPPRTFRIAILGDSFTQAQQIAEDLTFCATTERRLVLCPRLHRAQSRFDRAEVLNFGCDGYGTAQELITLERRVWKFQPDLVVLAIFTGNDLRNNSVVLEGDKCRPFFNLRDGALTPAGQFEDSFWFRMRCMLRFESRHIQLLNTAGRARSAIRAWLRSRRAAAAGKPPRPLLTEPGINDLIYRAPADRVWKEAWEITEREISEVNRECLRHRVRFLALTLANPPQDNPNPISRASYAKSIGADGLDYPDVRIQQLGHREGFDVLSLAPPMRIYAETNQVVLHGFNNSRAGAGHWNQLGHQIAGNLIAAHICATVDAPC